MTIPATTRVSPIYLGDASATNFAFSYKTYAKQELQVIISDGLTPQTLVLDSDYSVTLNADQITSPGGVVTYPISGSPLPVGRSLVIVSAVPNQQDISLPTGGAFNASIVELGFDRQEVQLQQFNDTLNRTIRVPAGESISTPLPAALVRANYMLGFDGLGNPVAVAPANGSAASLATDLTSTSQFTKGAGQVGFNAALVYPSGTVGDQLGATGRIVATVAAVRALSKTGVGKAFALGYYASGDGGGGQYYYDSTDTTSSDNGGTVLVAADGGRWKLAAQGGAVSIRQFGAVGDGVADDTAAINAALTAFKHVVVPAGMTPLISSTIAVPVAKRLEFLGGFGNASGAYPAAYFIKKSTMTTVAVTVADRAWVSGGGIVGQAGNTGDGIQIIGNSSKVSHFLVHGAGGNGVRVGTDAGGNFNSFELQRVTSQYNGGNGFLIHDGKMNVGADANAGTLTQCFAHYNTSSGFLLQHCFWVTVLNCLSESNGGYGIYLSGANDGTGVPQCRYATVIGGDFNEGNTAGQLFDQSYLSTFINPDNNNVPTTAGSGLPGSAVRNVITGGFSKLYGLTVLTNTGNYPVVIDDGQAGNLSNAVTLKKRTTAGNGQGVGLAFSIDPNTGSPVNAGKVSCVQNTGGVYGLVLSGYKAGAETDALTINFNANCVAPASDNTLSSGASSLRWNVVYAATSAINTSDATTKQQIAGFTDAETRVAKRLKGLMRTFKFNDSVAEKGADARIHVGTIAQDVQAAFVAEGLDPTRYSIFCSDTWWEYDGQPVDVDEQGMYELRTRVPDPEIAHLQPLNPDETDAAVIEADRLARAATVEMITKVQATQVTRLGLRYEEMFAFIIGAL